VTGKRLVVGVVVMGIAVPLTLFLLLGLQTVSQFLTVATVTVLAWGVSDLLATILERPRLSDRSPGKALKEGLGTRSNDER
jgi:hypothetical protein